MSLTNGFLNMPPAMMQYLMQQKKQTELQKVADQVQQNFAQNPQVIKHNPYLPALAGAFAKLGGAIGQHFAGNSAPNKTEQALMDFSKKKQGIAKGVDFTSPSSFLDAAHKALALGDTSGASTFLNGYKTLSDVATKQKEALTHAKNADIKQGYYDELLKINKSRADTYAKIGEAMRKNKAAQGGISKAMTGYVQSIIDPTTPDDVRKQAATGLVLLKNFADPVSMRMTMDAVKGMIGAPAPAGTPEPTPEEAGVVQKGLDFLHNLFGSDNKDNSSGDNAGWSVTEVK